MCGVMLAILGMGGLFSSCIDGKVPKLLVSLCIMALGIAWGVYELGFNVPLEAW